jgi:hypothetical protein
MLASPSKEKQKSLLASYAKPSTDLHHIAARVTPAIAAWPACFSILVVIVIAPAVPASGFDSLLLHPARERRETFVRHRLDQTAKLISVAVILTRLSGGGAAHADWMRALQCEWWHRLFPGWRERLLLTAMPPMLQLRNSSFRFRLCLRSSARVDKAVHRQFAFLAARHGDARHSNLWKRAVTDMI